MIILKTRSEVGVGIASENCIAIYRDFGVCIEIQITIYRTPK